MFWILALIPLLFPIVVKIAFRSSINYTEWAIQTMVGFLAVVLMYNVGKYSQLGDTELWNGEVTNKEYVQQNCPRGWRDHRDMFCRVYTTRTIRDGQTCSGSGTERICTPNYKTQYNYVYLWERNWVVRSNIGLDWEISRIDMQGVNIPPRWDIVMIGDPVSKTNSYQNYVKAADSSLFNRNARLADAYRESIPTYPIKIYDYYRVDRAIVSPGTEVANLAEYNQLLPKILKVLGPKKQANIVLLFTNITDTSYADAVINSWQGAKKNDSVIFIGVNEVGDVLWTKIHSWSKNKMFNVEMRDAILNLGSVTNAAALISLIETTTMAHFERQSMKEFEYLKDEIEPSTTAIVLIVIVLLILSAGLTWVFHKNEVNLFGSNNGRFRR